MATAKQPHPATAADSPTPLLLQNSPTPTILLSLQNSSTAPVPGHNQAKEARLYSNTTAGAPCKKSCFDMLLIVKLSYGEAELKDLSEPCIHGQFLNLRGCKAETP